MSALPKSKVLTVKNGSVYCQISGDKNPLLIAIPGYGVTLDFFDPAVAVLKDKFTIWVIDLPGHGQTKWSSDIFTIADFTEIIQAILEETGTERFSLMGHSFGGRAVLTQIPVFGQELEQVFLLAPDGIKTTSLMTQRYVPNWFRRLTKSRFEKGERILSVAEWLYKWKILPKHIYSFARYYLSDPVRRKQVVLYWLSLGDFQVDLKKVKTTILENNLSVLIVLGDRDKIIPLEVGKIIKKDIEDQVSISVVPTGHLLEGGAMLGELLK